MKKTTVLSRVCGLLIAGAICCAALVASADTPNPTCAVILERIWNDCPSSTLTNNNGYPVEIWIQDETLDCVGFANLHSWRFSEDCVNAAVFQNNSAFRFAADLVVTGSAQGEAGLMITPWWSQSDGRFNVKTTDGEIACFGGRLPFFSFTAQFGVTYAKGEMIHLEMTYRPNELTEQNPGTIEYSLTYAGSDYNSGPLAFDQGNPNEPEYGFWGITDGAQAGGHIQALLEEGNPEAWLRASWTNIEYENLEGTPTQASSWGRLKGLYR